MHGKSQPTADGVYDWAVRNEVPAPDAFAMQYWDMDGNATRLKRAAAEWRQQVADGTTGFPLVDEKRTGP
jgi:hypothetical protein